MKSNTTEKQTNSIEGIYPVIDDLDHVKMKVNALGVLIDSMLSSMSQNGLPNSEAIESMRFLFMEQFGNETGKMNEIIAQLNDIAETLEKLQDQAE